MAAAPDASGTRPGPTREVYVEAGEAPFGNSELGVADRPISDAIGELGGAMREDSDRIGELPDGTRDLGELMGMLAGRVGLLPDGIREFTHGTGEFSDAIGEFSDAIGVPGVAQLEIPICDPGILPSDAGIL